MLNFTNVYNTFVSEWQKQLNKTHDCIFKHFTSDQVMHRN